MESGWNVASTYGLSVYGPNGFVRYFRGSIGSEAAVLDVTSNYHVEESGSIGWRITNLGSGPADVSVLDAYTGNTRTKHLQIRHKFEGELESERFGNWYDLIVTVAGDASFNYRLAGHVETGEDSISDPAMGGLVTLKG